MNPSYHPLTYINWYIYYKQLLYEHTCHILVCYVAGVQTDNVRRQFRLFFVFIYIHGSDLDDGCPLNIRINYAQNVNVSATITILIITNYKSLSTSCCGCLRQDGGLILEFYDVDERRACDN